MPQDYAVPCQIVTEDSALEMSLAENVVRLAMHPADQYDAFAELIEQGHTATEVAARFGIDESLVHKRMKLARVAPELVEAYRNEELSLECLMAFTVSNDHGCQLHVFNSLKAWQKDDPAAIRDSLTGTMVDASSKLAQFVGLEEYTAAGGASRRDLFSEEVYLEDPALLDRLADEKLESIRRKLEAEGWGWIEINPERDDSLVHRCTRIRPQLKDAPSELLDQRVELLAELETIEEMLDESESDEQLDQHQAVRGRLDEVEHKLAAYVGFDAGQKALAGCFVSIGQDGTPSYDMGLVKPEHRKQLAVLTGESDPGAGKVKPKNPLPESLRRDLAADRLQIARVEIARHPAIAFDLLVFQVASVTFNHPTNGGADVQFRRHRMTAADEAAKATAQALAEVAGSLPLAWLKPKTEAARFEAFRLLPEESKLDLLAYCMALTLKPRLTPTSGEDVTAYDLALSLTSGSVETYWRPTRENFFSRVTREQLLAIRTEVLGSAWGKAYQDDKKGTLVEQLHRAFADPDASGRRPEQVEKLKSWLPACMTFTVNLPKPAKAKKARKAA